MCTAQHCLDRELGCGRGDTFLCRPVPSCRTSFILAVCSEKLPAREEIVSVVPMPGHRLLADHRRLALEGKIRAACALSSVSRGVLRGVL
jgi:hypothetical protein